MLLFQYYRFKSFFSQAITKMEYLMIPFNLEPYADSFGKIMINSFNQKKMKINSAFMKIYLFNHFVKQLLILKNFVIQ